MRFHSLSVIWSVAVGALIESASVDPDGQVIHISPLQNTAEKLQKTLAGDAETSSVPILFHHRVPVESQAPVSALSQPLPEASASKKDGSLAMPYSLKKSAPLPNRGVSSSHPAETAPKKTMSYGELIWSVNQVRDSSIDIHHQLKSYVSPDGLEFLRFAEEYPTIKGEMILLGDKIAAMDPENEVVFKVRAYYHKVRTVLHLLEILCGIKLREYKPESNTDLDPELPEAAELKALASNIVNVELYLYDLYEAHRKFQFSFGFGNFETGIESANSQFETLRKEAGVPSSPVSESELEKVEASLERLTTREYGPAVGPETATSYLMVTPEKNDQDIRRKFVVRYLRDRLRFVRRCVYESSTSSVLGLHSSSAANAQFHAICDEVRTQLDGLLSLLTKRPARLLNYLLQATLFKVRHLEQISSIAKRPGNKPKGIFGDESYSHDELSGIKGELENSLVLLKQVHDGRAALSADHFRRILAENRGRSIHMCEYLKGREWYLKPEAGTVKLLEGEIWAIVATMEGFVPDLPEEITSTATLAEVSRVATPGRNSSRGCWGTWSCCS